jgi:acyl carrier protein
MDKEEFLKSFAKQFEQTDPSLITIDSDFKQLEEWDSLIALSIIALADEEYGITLTGDDIRNSKTVGELFERITQLK